MKRIILIAALLTAGTAIADDSRSGKTGTTGTPTGQTGTQTGQTGTQTGQTGTGTQQQARMTDGEVVSVLMAVNTGEVQLGELARSRASSADVKAFAERMVNEHGALNKRLQDMTSRIGVTQSEGAVTQRLRADVEQMQAQMRNLKGADFDRAYIEGQVTQHTRVLEIIDTQILPNVQNDELKGMVNELKPNIQAHLTQARQIQTKLKAGASL